MMKTEGVKASRRGLGGAGPGQGCRGRVALVVAQALAMGLLAFASRPARACSPGNPNTTVKPVALPGQGATDVPTATSLVIIAPGQPSDVTLEAGGVAVPLGPVTAIGGGQDAATGSPVGFWQVKTASQFLPASAELALSMADGKGGRVALTTFHTAAGYDKQQGTAAVLKSLTLTRVRHPVSEIGSGDCVFSEYIGYISFESDAAVIPGTPAASVVNTIDLSPKNGGAAPQARTFTGATPYSGTPVGTITDFGAWYPYLDPTLEYCATITSFGYGDLARLPSRSNTVCARVKEVVSPNFAGATDGGVETATTDAAPPGDGGVDASADGSQFTDSFFAGCAAGSGGGAGPAALALLVLAWLLASARRSAAAVSRAARGRRS
jgi:hypothetical protein